MKSFKTFSLHMKIVLPTPGMPSLLLCGWLHLQSFPLEIHSAVPQFPLPSRRVAPCPAISSPERHPSAHGVGGPHTLAMRDAMGMTMRNAMWGMLCEWRWFWRWLWWWEIITSEWLRKKCQYYSAAELAELETFAISLRKTHTMWYEIIVGFYKCYILLRPLPPPQIHRNLNRIAYSAQSTLPKTLILYLTPHNPRSPCKS